MNKKSPTNLWIEVRDELNLYGSLWPQQFAKILATIANHVEQRGARGLDLDPGETSDWLRDQAQKTLNEFQ